MRSISNHPYGHRIFAHQRRPESLRPIPLLRALSCRVQSMANIVCFFLLVDSNEASSIQLGMCALPLYCRSFYSDGVWPFVVVRAPRHMIRVMLAVPKKCKYLCPQAVGLGVVLYVLSSLVDCTLHQKTSLYECESSGRVHCGVVGQHHEWQQVIPVVMFARDEHCQHC